jgi:hypothetical protein
MRCHGENLHPEYNHRNYLISLQLVLNSMHKYQPRIHLVKRHETSGSAPITDLESEEYKTFIFPESVFTAVTAYQNQLVSATAFCIMRRHNNTTEIL